MKTPEYRGTLAVLTFEKDNARAWMIDQCRQAVAGSDMSDEIRAEALKLITAAETDDTDFFRQSVTWKSSGGYWHNPENSPNRFHQWEIGQNLRSNYGRQKFLLRRDNTVHRDNLEMAIRQYAAKEISRRRSADVYEKNKQDFELLGKPGVTQGADVILSRSVVGECTVSMSHNGVKFFKTTCKIIQAGDVAAKMKDLSVQWSEFKGSLK